MSGSKHLIWASTGRTDVGRVRKVNEDAILMRPDIQLWVVADGMGGHSAGDVASGTVIDTLKGLKRPGSLSEFTDAVEEALCEANTKLREIAVKEDITLGSTVVVLLGYAQYAVCMWVGDSRIYRYRGESLERLTQDHTMVETLVEQGMLTAEAAEQHPQASLITRAVGAEDQLYVDADIYEAEEGDRYMLCSDGLTKELSEEEMAEILAASEDTDKSVTLLQLALDRGARDNTSVITVQLTEPSALDDKTIAPTHG